MKLAEVLSDLNTLRVCDHAAALALVSARPTPPSLLGTTSSTQNVVTGTQSQQQEENDVDLQRARDLLRLHSEVKVAREQGAIERELREARRMVREAIEEADGGDEEETWS
jgi:hypothetical protein